MAARPLAGVLLSSAMHAALLAAVVLLVPRDEGLPALMIDLTAGAGGERPGGASGAAADPSPAAASRRAAGRGPGVARAPRAPAPASHGEARAPAPPLPARPDPTPAPAPPTAVAPPAAPAPSHAAETAVPAPSPRAVEHGVAAAFGGGGGARDGGVARAAAGGGRGGAGEGGHAGRGAGTGGGDGVGAGSGAARSGGEAGAEYTGYLARFRQRVQETLRYPPGARRRGLEGTVHVEVVILPSGAVGPVAVVRSSSHAMLDEAAVETVRTLPALPFPADVPARVLRVRLPVVFELR